MVKMEELAVDFLFKIYHLEEIENCQQIVHIDTSVLELKVLGMPF
jgi:hypothetical protein